MMLTKPGAIDLGAPAWHQRHQWILYGAYFSTHPKYAGYREAANERTLTRDRLVARDEAFEIAFGWLNEASIRGDRDRWERLWDIFIKAVLEP